MNDKQLQHNVQTQLEWDPSVDASRIGVTARDGVVTLSGTVLTIAERQQAEKETKRVYGVKAVANEIEVKVSDILQRNDTDIAAAILDYFRWDSTVPEGAIKVVVSKGWVTLEGVVDWQFQRESAESHVRKLIGVRGVTNAIALKQRASKIDIQRKIEEAFERNAELDARRVDVNAHDGRVVLHGNVRSWAERDQAQKAAWAAPGVIEVDNRITVTP